MIYKNILSNISKKKQFFLLVDPDKQSTEKLSNLLGSADLNGVDAFLLGGSLVSESVDPFIDVLKKFSSIPVLLFPGSLLQISQKADGILLLSLISGRNPEFLIGNQVVAAPVIRRTRLEVIPTGYMLIDRGAITSVEYMSNTKPIPADKTDIAVATAMAGEMMGQKLMYLEAGSGAPDHIPLNMIAEVKKHIQIPLIVGGGIKSADHAISIAKAGADIIVVGNATEKNPTLIKEIAQAFKTLPYS